MKTLGIVLLGGLLLLWTELPPACGQEGEGQNCPQDEYVCIRAERNECENNAGCTGGKICCQNRCAKRCVFPDKPGECPKFKCLSIPCRPEPDQCTNDCSCQGNQKCCMGCCSKHCMNPGPVKSGTCPIDICRCSGPQPNECENDLTCEGKKKCCYKCCAMQCVDPEPST